MNEAIISNWNNTITKNDVIYHVGDFGFPSRDGDEYNTANIIHRLNGEKHLILGNHDKESQPRGWASVSHTKTIKIEGRKIVLFHFPIESWESRLHYSWHIHGHTHGMLPDDPNKLRVDVGLDAFCKKNYSPVSYEEIRDFMKTKTYVAKSERIDAEDLDGVK
jgi:calcineurin-like phosphoesterase family protein